ncbi:MAG TPA: hypothetical protein VJM50_00640 [Pyrinomonadaceae bacterium]|nr:hypothetical protein [Pyrinomonadaceae bacterium]
MSTPFKVQTEKAYERHVFLAVELLDAVTLTRVTEGVKVVAEGLQGKPIVNSGGVFVWLRENNPTIRKVSIDTGVLPYENFELDGAQVKFPLTTVELQPAANYLFSPGVTGLRGTLIEQNVTPRQPVGGAQVRLRWLDDNGNWIDSPTTSLTDAKSGDFVSILRLAPKEKPDIDANGAVTVRLQVRRNGSTRSSTDLRLLQGRITDPSTLNTLTFAWDELQP